MSTPPPFDLNDEPRPQESPVSKPRPTGVLASLGAVGLLLFKLKGVLAVVKFLPLLKTMGWMFVYLFVTAWRFGWPAAVILLIVIFVHELGHVIALKIQGRPVYAMTFIPFIGAWVQHDRAEHVTKDAFVALAGPFTAIPLTLIFGGLFFAFPSALWIVGIQFALMINLFNLIPAPFFDGGRVIAMLSPKLWAVGMAIALFIAWRNPIVWFIALMSLPMIIAGWKTDVEKEPYLKVTTAQGVGYTLAYLALALVLALGNLGFHQLLSRVGG
jgi:Zn-dependent protease